MKKSELETGMRVVHGNHPKKPVGVIILDLDKICYKDGGWNFLSVYSEDMKANAQVWDITAVYDVHEYNPLSYNLENRPIYVRKDKSAEEIQLEKVTAKIHELIDEANKLKEVIKNK